MALGYTYERVLTDEAGYLKQTGNGKFYEWWAEYIAHQGLQQDLRPLNEAANLQSFHGPRAVGILGLTFEHLRWRHVAAIDVVGVVDPANGFPNHMEVAEYVATRQAQGGTFDRDFRVIYPRN
jgi:hypothetical protein